MLQMTKAYLFLFALSMYASADFSLSCNTHASFNSAGPLVSFSLNGRINCKTMIHDFRIDGGGLSDAKNDTDRSISAIIGFSYAVGVERFFPGFYIGPAAGIWLRADERYYNFISGTGFYLAGLACSYERGDKWFLACDGRLLLGLKVHEAGTFLTLDALPMVGIGVGYRFGPRELLKRSGHD